MEGKTGYAKMRIVGFLWGKVAIQSNFQGEIIIHSHFPVVNSTMEKSESFFRGKNFWRG